jgi:hypothetical protein
MRLSDLRAVVRPRFRHKETTMSQHELSFELELDAPAEKLFRCCTEQSISDLFFVFG